MLFLIHQIYYTVSKNLSILEIILLLFSIIIVLCNRRKYPYIPPLYSVFLILYITLLRRAPGFNVSICFKLKLRPNAVVWAGNLLNLVLYVPYGVTYNRHGDVDLVRPAHFADSGHACNCHF